MEAQLKAALRQTARITRREARNFYFAFFTLPRLERLGVFVQRLLWGESERASLELVYQS